MRTNGSKSLHSFLADNLAEVPKSGIRDFFDIVSTMDDVISLGIGEPDFATPWHVREASVYALEHGATGYTSNMGLLKLRQELSTYVGRTFGVNYDPDEEILITVGVSEALDLAIRAVVNPGDEVIYHEPCYVSYKPLITFARGVPVVVETSEADGFRMTAEALKAKITNKTKAVLLNFPNNPTGGAMRPEDIQGIADLAIEHDLLVITDEIYAELTYEREHPSIAALPGMRERTIFLHGFSKAWAMTGFRIGYACAPPVLTDAMMKIHQYTMLCAPILSQEAALEALRYPEEDIQEMKSSYLKRRNFVYNSFKEMGIPCRLPEGAFYAFPDISGFGMNAHDFAYRFLDAKKVACVPGTAFGGCGEGHIRCSYATSMEALKEAMARLAEFKEEQAYNPAGA